MKQFIDSSIFILSLTGGQLKGSFPSKRLTLDIFIPFSKRSKLAHFQKPRIFKNKRIVISSFPSKLVFGDYKLNLKAVLLEQVPTPLILVHTVRLRHRTETERLV